MQSKDLPEAGTETLRAIDRRRLQVWNPVWASYPLTSRVIIDVRLEETTN